MAGLVALSRPGTTSMALGTPEFSLGLRLRPLFLSESERFGVDFVENCLVERKRATVLI
jgi:hypothetical protein